MMIKAGDDDYFDKNGNLASISMPSILCNSMEQPAEAANVVNIADVSDVGHVDALELDSLIERDVQPLFS